MHLSLEVNAESKPFWIRARRAAKKELPANCPRPGNNPIAEEELARRISMIRLSDTSGDSFTVYFDCDETFTDHAVSVYGSLEKGVKDTYIEGLGIADD